MNLHDNFVNGNTAVSKISKSFNVEDNDKLLCLTLI